MQIVCRLLDCVCVLQEEDQVKTTRNATLRFVYAETLIKPRVNCLH